MKFNKKYLLIFLFLFFIPLVLSLSNEQNISVEEQAKICLNESEVILNELMSENFSVLRVNDTFIQGKNLYDAQILLKEKNRNHDFSLVLPYCNEIKLINKKAIESRDEFFALKKFYSEIDVEEMNTSSIDEIILEIENETRDERYENVKPLIDKAYDEILNVKADYITSNIFYNVVARNLKQFFYENWIYFIFSLGILFLLFLIYKNTISRIIINRKIYRLEIRKKNLTNLIKEAQYEFFSKGKISEGTYNIRVKKFAELVRDINRQIPLLKESLFKLKKSKS